MNYKKLKGIAMMSNAVFSIVGGVAILTILTTIVFDLKHLVQGPAKQFSASLASISAKVAKTGKTIDNATLPVAAIEQELAAALRNIDRIPEEIEIPKIGIPNITLRIKPRLTVASQESTPGYKLAKYAGERPTLVYSGSAEYQPAVWHDSRQRPRLIHAAFPKPKISTPSIPKPSVPKPSLPTVKVNWDNLNVPMPAIPPTRVPVPGLKHARSLLIQNASILREMRNLLGISPLLDSLRTFALRLTDEKQRFIRTVSMLGGKLLALFCIIAVLATIIVVRLYLMPYFSWIYGQFTVGWTLARDQQAPSFRTINHQL